VESRAVGEELLLHLQAEIQGSALLVSFIVFNDMNCY
jgi:hypothetical protein